ncbi:hypothetical protein QVD17_24908 [Tagetes erecta]|uniref:Uncharacterized protein n=1 Tax=Tagetes erecta TaxID=13708 RepID=A0AAD8KM23_TARER|nr:hypothetical protein QVD17_24908 [Tagetes erecta]
MAGPPTTTVKPSRSDEIIDPNHQLQITQQIKSHFDSLLPNRHPKPNRSDPDHNPSQSLSHRPTATIPELINFQFLTSQSQEIVSDGGATVEDEFVETGYYNQLISIDKEHHTTGSGFIKVAMEKHGDDDDGLYDLGFRVRSYGGFRDQVVKSNPAMNDWVPASDYFDQDEFVSSKPNRSEN